MSNKHVDENTECVDGEDKIVLSHKQRFSLEDAGAWGETYYEANVGFYKIENKGIKREKAIKRKLIKFSARAQEDIIENFEKSLKWHIDFMANYHDFDFSGIYFSINSIKCFRKFYVQNEECFSDLLEKYKI